MPSSTLATTGEFSLIAPTTVASYGTPRPATLDDIYEILANLAMISVNGILSVPGSQLKSNRTTIWMLQDCS
jgi:hypothetical protein